MPDNTTSGLFSSPADFSAAEVWRAASLNEGTLGPPSCFPRPSAALTTGPVGRSSVSIRVKRAAYTSARLSLRTTTRGRIVVVVLSHPPTRAPSPRRNHDPSNPRRHRVRGRCVREGKVDMNEKNEWISQGECIQITTGFFRSRCEGKG